MNRNIAIGIIVFIIIIGGVLLFLKRGPSAVDTITVNKEEDELTALNNDFDLFAADEAALDEINQTFNDVAETTETLNAAKALDNVSISQEADQADLSGDITSFNNDEAQLQEINQAFNEILQ